MTMLSRKNIPAKECQKLIKSLPDECQKKTGNLMKYLTVVVGMIVVKYIDYRMEVTNRPSIIWVCLMILELEGQHEKNTERYKYPKRMYACI